MPASRTVSENSVQIDDNESSPTTSKADLDAASTYSQSQRANAATSSRDILVFLVAFRILNALCIKTFFQPDEYFQSLEPAWRIAFGPDSGAWITWEWEHHLRSTIIPYIFAGGYRVADFIANYLGAGPFKRAEILIVTPKIIQAHIAACGDYFTWRLAERVYGKRSLEAWICLALTVCSPWQWFCSTRTLSNCLETTMTVIAMNYWPWEWSLRSVDETTMADSVRLEQDPEHTLPERPLRLRRCLVLAAFACILRPTNILIWILVTYFALFRVIKHERMVASRLIKIPLMISVSIPRLVNATRRERWILLWDATLYGAGVLLLSVLCDWTFYHKLTFTPFNFLYFNIAKSLAVFYGRNDWHYYLTQGYPLLLTTFLPFAVLGIYEGLTDKDDTDDEKPEPERLTSAIRYQLTSVCLTIPLALSFISHKEVRFIYPILPLLHVLSSPSAAACIRPSLIAVTATPTPASSLQSSPMSSRLMDRSYLYTKPYKPWSKLSAYRPTILPTILLLNLLIAMFTTQHHQRGVLSVLTYLRTEHETKYLTQPPALAHLPPADTTMTVGFLMPCHSTPWRSHLIHPNIQAWSLGCEPPVHVPPGPEREAYLDEADRFFADPQHFLQTEIGPASTKSVNKQPRSGFGLAAAIFGNKQSAVTEASSSYTDIDIGTSTLFPLRSICPWNGGLGRKPWPEYLVFFEASSKDITEVIAPLGYIPCWRGWNSWFHDDWRRQGDVIVWCRKGNLDSKKLKLAERRQEGWKW
ncbi:MAG: hypothetical protein GOMPHAMPRED_001069 [Gomphillus americanus]|uniref:Mannosyltransferase n=1 Tax=Gomphillus americanus TaxID=1940652 RepID=A0A8H3IIB8_9LECA|nr:MAG: hypothetical protein GOMPHAMPRED_001069 [Gomphillus americanus]